MEWTQLAIDGSVVARTLAFEAFGPGHGLVGSSRRRGFLALSRMPSVW